MDVTPSPSVPPPTVSGPSSRRGKKLYIIGGIVGFIILVGVATLFAPYLTTKVGPGKKFKVLGPSIITVGKVATITWDTSSDNAKRYPTEKIEYCAGSLLKPKCILLAAAAPNNGKATVKVPASLPKGKGYLKFTARDSQKRLLPALTANFGALTVKQAVTVSQGSSDGGGSGGGGGGSSDNGGGGGNSAAVQKATPQPPYGGDGGAAAYINSPANGLHTTQGADIYVNVDLYYSPDVTVQTCEMLVDGQNPSWISNDPMFPVSACTGASPY